MRVLNGHYKLDISISILPSGMSSYMSGADGIGTRMKHPVEKRLMNTSVCNVIKMDTFINFSDWNRSKQSPSRNNLPNFQTKVPTILQQNPLRPPCLLKENRSPIFRSIPPSLCYWWSRSPKGMLESMCRCSKGGIG